MATLQDRNFSRNYEGLKNQLGVAAVLAAVCLTGYEIMRRKRRGRGFRLKNGKEQELGSVETWEFGYLYQGRCWAKNPSPALPKWPLAWVKQAIMFPEKKLPELIGIDATLYIRFLKGTRLFVFLHTLTTFPVIFTLHVVFSDPTIPSQSMDKASLSSVVENEKGKSLLFVHVIILWWITTTWVLNLLWIARGMFRYRAELLEKRAAELANMDPDTPEHENRALRLRTIMVTNVPVPLRTEAALKDYFEYYMSRPLAAPPLTKAGTIATFMGFLFNQASHSSAVKRFRSSADTEVTDHLAEGHDNDIPAIVDRVVIARKMTELASLLDRRTEVLKKLEHSHIKLAKKALSVTRERLHGRDPISERRLSLTRRLSRSSTNKASSPIDPEADAAQQRLVTQTLAPFVSEFNVPSPKAVRRNISRFRHFAHTVTPSLTTARISEDTPNSNSNSNGSPISSPTTTIPKHGTVWEALHSLPRSALDPFQPLIRLNRLFRGQTVPAIDYYAAKLDLLTALVEENRGRSLNAFQPSSTAFVTFERIEDARRAAKYLQVHPRNPLACIVVPAPDTGDLDWARVMKSSFRGEFLKDWVVDLGVWAFTCSWVIPITFFVGLVNIQNLSIFVPGLKTFFDNNPHDKEAISSLLPTILVSLLTILIPMLLLLIAKKAHTIITFSKLHDTIMIRYWKFLVCNLLIFFCVGVAALESFLQSFKASFNFIAVVGGSFPVAGPFYVGWLILQTSVHGFLELGLYGLPLILYPATRASTTLRRRAAGTRPRTFNFYYWLPNHVLVTTIVVCFALLNPLVIPFALVYFLVESVIVKHQLIHVYAKQYENNGKLLLVRIVRYSLDGLILAHVIFLAFCVVLKRSGPAAGTGVLLGLTAIGKLILTRLCRAKFTEVDRAEDFIYSAPEREVAIPDSRISAEPPKNLTDVDIEKNSALSANGSRTLSGMLPYGSARFWTWKLPHGVPFHYASYPPHHNHKRLPQSRHATRRGAIPFTQDSTDSRFSRIDNVNSQIDTSNLDEKPVQIEVASATPVKENGSEDARPAFISPHPKHPTWDDFPHLDRPYDNPFYTAPIDNFLWLPRNPFGVLDLDDSVDVHETLTSEPGAGKPGRWMNGGPEGVFGEGRQIVATPGEMSSPEAEPSELSLAPPSRPPLTRTGSFNLGTPDQRYSGNEVISLSSVLSSRASRIEDEDEVEDTVPARSFILNQRRRQSEASTRRRVSIHGRETSVFSGTVPLHRPLTKGSQLSVFSQARSRTHVQDPVNSPDIQAQGDLLAARESRLDVPEAERSQAISTPVPIRDAVVEEAIVEEQEEAMERIRREQEEQRSREASKPAWWNAWLWNRSKPDEEANPGEDKQGK